MSAEDIQTLLHMSPTVSSEEIAKIFTHLQGLRDPLDEDFSIEFGVQADETRLRSETHLVGTDAASSKARTRLCTRLGTTMIRKIADPVNFYPLVHVENSFSGIKFPSVDTKFGGRVDADGSGYITIADEARLNPTDAITLIGWAYLPANTTANHVIAHKGTPYIVRGKINSELEFVVTAVTSGQHLLTFTYPLNIWFHFACTFKNTPENRARIYLNAIQQGADVTTTGNLTTTTTALGILANAAGAALMVTGERIAWLSILNAELTSAQITDHKNGILDTDAYKEILTIPFVGDAKPKPESSFGIAKVT